MPVERRSGASQARAIALGVVVLVLAVAAAWGVVALASGGDGPVRMNLGDDVFDAGQAARLSRQIGADGPLLFSDVSGRGQLRPIVVNHFGDDPATRWVAFTAVVPGAEENCFLSWNEERNLFEERAAAEGAGREVGDRCRDVTVSADGSSASDGSTVEQFPWRIDTDGNLVVDLRPDDDRNGD
jgi:hypothetical protein